MLAYRNLISYRNSRLLLNRVNPKCRHSQSTYTLNSSNLDNVFPQQSENNYSNDVEFSALNLQIEEHSFPSSQSHQNDFNEGSIYNDNYHKNILYERQLLLEDRQFLDAKSTTQNLFENLNKMGRGSSVKFVQKIMLNWYNPLLERIGEELENVVNSCSKIDITSQFLPAIILVGSDRAAVIALTAIINSILSHGNKGSNLSTLAREIAEQIQNDVRAEKQKGTKKYVALIKANSKPGKLPKHALKQMFKILDDSEWPIAMKIQLGTTLIKMLVETALTRDNKPAIIHEIIFNKKTKKKIGVLRLEHNTFMEMLNYDNVSFQRYLPMLIPPRPWKKVPNKPLEGCYYSIRTTFLRFRNQSQSKILQENIDMSGILDGLNYLGKMPWVINKVVLSVVTEMYKNGDCIGEMPSKTDYPMPSHDSCMKPKKEHLVHKITKYKEMKKDRMERYQAGLQEVIANASIAEKVDTEDDIAWNIANTDVSGGGGGVGSDILLTEEHKTSVPPSGHSTSSVPSIEELKSNIDDLNSDEVAFDSILHRYLCRKVSEKNQENHSLKCDMNIKLSVAHFFKDDVVYFPWNLDFRGRAYPIPPNLNHMGSDLCRALLKFSEKKALGKGGLDWLKIHLCNLFGNNKISIKDRIKWSDSHIEDIIESATNPITGKRWWATSESPFQSLATCVEIGEALKCERPEEYLSNMPIHQDGSCNGLQHYAALGRDEAGGRAVNLMNAEVPQDVYTKVLDLVKIQIDQDCNIPEDAEDLSLKSKRRCAHYVRGHVDRKVIKQTVMTSVYGVTTIGARAQILGRLKEKLFGDNSLLLSKEQDQEVYQSAEYVLNYMYIHLCCPRSYICC